MAHAQKLDFVFRRNGRVNLNWPEVSVQSTTGSRGVRISGSNAGYTMFRDSVKSTGYPLHSPVSPSLLLPCATVCHHISTALYQHTALLMSLASIHNFGTQVCAANHIIRKLIKNFCYLILKAWGTWWRTWFRHCATSQKVAGSIPDVVTRIFRWHNPFRPHYGPGVGSASNRNEFQEYFLGG